MKFIKQTFRTIFQYIIRFIAYLLFMPKTVYQDKAAIKKSDEPVIFLCNHRSFYDGALVAVAVHKKQQNTVSTIPRVLIAKDWYEKRILHQPLMWFGGIPINRFKPDTSWVTKAKAVLENGQSVLIFPEGKTSQGEMNPFHPGFALLAQRTGARIVPCAICSRYRWFDWHTKVIVGTPYPLPNPPGMKHTASARLAAEDAQQRVKKLYESGGKL